MMDMSRIYHGDRDGRWWVTTWKPQCHRRMFFLSGVRCQATKDHADDHWAYGPDGSYYWEAADVPGVVRAPTDVAAGIVPPAHPSWISPVNRSSCRDEFTHEEVTDPDLIAKLSAGEDVGAPVTRPCSPEDVVEMEREGMLVDGKPATSKLDGY